MVDPDAKLEEELIVRPTSETIIWNTYKGLDPVLPRPADPLQPVGERRTAGRCYPPVPAHGGISLAGGPHGPCTKEEAIEEVPG